MGTVALPCPYLIPATRQTPCAAAALPTVAKPGRPCHFPTWSLEVAVRAGSGNLNNWDKWIFCLRTA